MAGLIDSAHDAAILGRPFVEIGRYVREFEMLNMAKRMKAISHMASLVLAASALAGIGLPHAALAQSNQAQAFQAGQPIDGDLIKPDRPQPNPAYSSTSPASAGASYARSDANSSATKSAASSAARTRDATYHSDDLIGAAEGVFGKGAYGLAQIFQDILKKQGEPNGYIVGREAGGAIAVGLRYGSGTLTHKIEGRQPVYWTGPSIGFDAGANAAKTFVLVYNLYNTDDLFHRYAAGEGQAYLVGGFHVSYLRRGDVVLIPVRMGVGLRLGINGGYMRFSKKQKWFPF